MESGLAPVANAACSIRTPRVLLYDTHSNSQIEEYLPNSLNLKTYALKHFSASTPVSEKPHVLDIGRGLGKWLRSFHDWAAAEDDLRELAGSNKAMQRIKFKYNYELLLARVDRFPATLSGAKPVFEEVVAMAKAELEDESRLQTIHGDFWTGK